MKHTNEERLRLSGELNYSCVVVFVGAVSGLAFLLGAVWSTATIGSLNLRFPLAGCEKLLL